MNIGIIGSGFFGITLGLILSKKHNVTIYEKKNDILQGASRINQFRFHRGYHYPRSIKTIKEIQKSYNDFIKFYGNDIFSKTDNYYAIAREDSKINFNEYIKILRKNHLPFKIVKNKKYISSKISGLILSNEKNLNYFKLKKKIKKMIKKNKNLKIVFNCRINKSTAKMYDRVFIVTYQNNNHVLKKLGFRASKKYKFELIEKIIVELKKPLRKKSFVVADGKFVCIDPYLGTKYHLLSDVLHSKLEVFEGYDPRFKAHQKKLIDKNGINKVNKSNFNHFLSHSSEYLPFLKNAKFIKSLFIVRTLKRNVEKTDERTSEFTKINNKYYTILSSKWNTCVTLAKKIERQLNL